MELADDQLESWHEDSLRELGFSRTQRQHLKALIDAGEVELAEIRERCARWSPEQVFAYYA